MEPPPFFFFLDLVLLIDPRQRNDTRVIERAEDRAVESSGRPGAGVARAAGALGALRFTAW